jgi:hypothetical protein
LIVTADSLHQPNILFEFGAAVGMGRRVVPIVAEEMRAADIPFPLRSRRSLMKEAPEKTAMELIEGPVLRSDLDHIPRTYRGQRRMN